MTNLMDIWCLFVASTAHNNGQSTVLWTRNVQWIEKNCKFWMVWWFHKRRGSCAIYLCNVRYPYRRARLAETEACGLKGFSSCLVPTQNEIGTDLQSRFFLCVSCFLGFSYALRCDMILSCIFMTRQKDMSVADMPYLPLVFSRDCHQENKNAKAENNRTDVMSFGVLPNLETQARKPDRFKMFSLKCWRFSRFFRFCLFSRARFWIWIWIWICSFEHHSGFLVF